MGKGIKLSSILSILCIPVEMPDLRVFRVPSWAYSCSNAGLVLTRNLLAAALFAVAAGCAKTVAAPPRTEIRYCFFGGFEDWHTWEAIAREFEQGHPDIHVQLLYWPGSNYEAKLQLTMAAGTAPDVMDVEDEPFAGQCQWEPFEDLRPYLARVPAEYAASRFFPTALETFRVHGKQLGLPWNGGQLMLFYNRALFREAGLPDPPPRDWSWLDWLAACKKLTRDRDGDGRIDQFGTEVNASYMNSLVPWIWDFGGDIIDPSMQHATTDTPAARQTLTFLHDLIYKYHVAPRSSEFTGMGGNVMFMTGRLGMTMNGVWGIPFMRQTDIDWDVTFLPRGPAGAYSRGTWDGVAMYRHSRHKEAAWEFIRFITGERGQYYVAQTGRAIPPRRSQAYSPAFLRPDTPQHEERCLEAMSQFRTQRLPERWAEMNVVLKRAMEKLASPTGNPDAIAHTLQQELDAILQRP
jgi:multiple sugar transport system substrate-binding protein